MSEGPCDFLSEFSVPHGRRIQPTWGIDCTEDLGRIVEWIGSGGTPRACKIRAAARVFHTKARATGLGMKKTARAELPWRVGRLQKSAAVGRASQSFDWAPGV